MTTPRALVLVLNSYRHDNRVERTSELLVNEGFQTTVVALQDGEENPLETRGRHSVVRVGGAPFRYRQKLLDLMAETRGAPRRFPVMVQLSMFRFLFYFEITLYILMGLRRTLSLERDEFDSGPIGRLILKIVEFQFLKQRTGYTAFSESALKVAEELRPVLVVANDLPTLPAALLIRSKLGAEFIYDSHELWLARNKPRQATSPMELTWESETEKEGLKKSLFSVTVCDSIADHLSRYYSVKRPLVVRNIPTHSAPGQDSKIPSLRNLCSASSEDFLCVYVGGVDHNRSLDEAIRAMSLLPVNVKLLLLGPIAPSILPQLRQLITQLSLGDRVTIPGPIPGNVLVSALKEANLSLILVKPVCLSYFFALPNKLFESMAAGLPMIGSRLPEIEELVEKSGAGDCYEPGNAEDLAAKIRRMVEDREFRESCAAKSAALAKLNTWEAETHKFSKTLQAHFFSNDKNRKQLPPH